MTRHPLPTIDEAPQPCPSCGMTLPSSVDVASFAFCPQCRFPLRLLAGKYRLLHEIAQGGAGVVYKATHIGLSDHPERAIKVIKPEHIANETMRQRFQREIQITAALSMQTPHVIRIYDDFGEEPQLGHFYVMEFVDGCTLSELLAQDGLTLDNRIHIFWQLCHAMKTAHQAGVIHRDLKPANLLLTTLPQEPLFLKVLDFGIAHTLQTDEAGQLTEGAIGTPSYMSPEQCINGPIDARADIYAMGIILSVMLTGRSPYFAKEIPSSPREIIAAHLHRQPLPLSQLTTSEQTLPKGLDPIVKKALAKRPADRFASVEALELALRPLFDTTEPEVAHTATVGAPNARETMVPATPGASAPPDVTREPSKSRLLLPRETATGSPPLVPPNAQPRLPLRDAMPVVTSSKPADKQPERPVRQTLSTPFVLLVCALLVLAGWLAGGGLQRDASPTTVPSQQQPGRGIARSAPDAKVLHTKAAPGRLDAAPPRARRRRTSHSPEVQKRAVKRRSTKRKRRRVALRKQHPQRLRRWLSQCPKTPYFWYLVLVTPASLQKSRPHVKGGTSIPVKGGHCIGVAKRSGSLRFGSLSDGLVPCSIPFARLSRKRKILRLKLLKEGGLEPTSAQYCLSPNNQ